jgi:hypothetical protein
MRSLQLGRSRVPVTEAKSMPRPQPQVWWVSSGLGTATRGDRVSRERTGCPGQEGRTTCRQTTWRRQAQGRPGVERGPGTGFALYSSRATCLRHIPRPLSPGAQRACLGERRCGLGDDASPSSPWQHSGISPSSQAR